MDEYARKFKHITSQYQRRTEGNMAIMTALGLMTILIAIGAAIDMSGLVKDKQYLQDIADSAALAAASDAASLETFSRSKARYIANQTVTKQCERAICQKSLKSTVNFDAANNITVFVEATRHNALMGLVGEETAPVKVKASSNVGSPGDIYADVHFLVDVSA